MSAAPIFERDEFTEGDEFGVTWHDFKKALAVFSWMNPSMPITVRFAAQSFNVADATIKEAVEDLYWVFLAGPDDDPTKQTIEHDGE